MTRKITRPSTARCILPMYIGFLLGEPQHGNCCRLVEVMDISHDGTVGERRRFFGRRRGADRSQRPPAWWEEGGEPAETFEQASPPLDPVAQPEPDFPCDRTIDW